MAGFPPPTPPFGSSLAGDPRRQARADRKQARCDRKQARLARMQSGSQLRQAWSGAGFQIRALGPTSLLAPLLLLLFGITALFVRSGHPALPLFLVWYGRWWPLLLLFAGLFLLIEWAFDFFLCSGAASIPPRRLGFGAVLLLAGSSIFGASTHHIRDAHTLLGDDVPLALGDFDGFRGQRRESSKALDSPFAPGTSLAVDNPHGNITLVGAAEDGRIHVVVHKQVYTDSDSDATQWEQQLDPQLTLSGGTLQLSIPKLVGATADLTITLPGSAATSLTAQRGSIDVSSLHAPLTMTAERGDITCRSIAGAVLAQINHSDSSFTAHEIHGNLTLRGHAQQLNLTDVEGQVSLEGEFFGNTHLERLHGPVAFRTRRTQLTLARLPGRVDISPNSELTGSRIVGPTALYTSSRNVSLDRMAGDVLVVNSKGTVAISSAAPLGNIDVQNRNGAIALTVPERAGLVLDASTRGGRINTDLGLEPGFGHGNQTLEGTVHGGGALVRLHTSHLDIDLHQGNTEPPTEH